MKITEKIKAMPLSVKVSVLALLALYVTIWLVYQWVAVAVTCYIILTVAGIRIINYIFHGK